MHCPVCGHENPEDAKFCAQCGSALSGACRVCASALEPSARFCSSCGTPVEAVQDRLAAPADLDLSRYVPEALLHKLRAARAGGAMRGERRTVTMLFADIQNSTAAAELLDPEEWAEIANGAFEHLISPVYRYEGTLARLQGDAILAFFGAPVAHEDDPIRAVHAGLAMIESIRDYAAEVERRTTIPIAIRVGINTGLVVVGEVGSDLRVEYTALGDAINVAARMEQSAEAGTVRITARTAALLGDVFATTTIGPVDVRGRVDPVTALRVDRVADVDSMGRAPQRTLGRARELDQMRAAVERLVTGIGGIVTVVGDAGMGKSRLLADMRREAEEAFTVATTSDAPGEIAWLQGHSRSFDSGVPYAPFLDLAVRWLDIVDLRDEGVFSRISADVERATGAPNRDMAALLTQVTGAMLPTDADAYIAALETPILHERTTAAIVDYLEAEANRRPMVLVLEDLHWADALSLGLAERLVDVAERAPMTLVLPLRPVRGEPAWRLVETVSREASHRHTAIQLEPLDSSSADALLERHLGGRNVTADDRRRILERADGNPLFVEELASSVGEGGASVIPSSLSGMLSARLDRLDDEARMVSEVAAVVGREFEPDAVAALMDGVEVDAALEGLVRHGVLTERRRLPRPLFAFRHALIQEAAYDTVLLRDRRALHGRLAAYLEGAHPDDPHEIARHHLNGDTPDAAFPWLVEAGVGASRAMSLAESIRLLSTALDHVPADVDPELVARIHLGLGEAYSLVPDLDQASVAYQQLADFGRANDRPAFEVSALNRLGFNAAVIKADFVAANDYLDGARALAEEVGDELGLAEYHMNSCFVAVAQGELDRAIEHDFQTALIGEHSGSDAIRVKGLVRRAINLVATTDFELAREALAEARSAAQDLGAEEPLALISAHGDAYLLKRDGELVESLELMTAGAEVLSRYGSFYTAMTQADAGRVALGLGEVETALTMLAAAIRTAESQRQAFTVSGAAATLARCYAICGDPATSRVHRERALDALGAPVGDFLSSSVWADLGHASFELGRFQDAQADFALGLEASSSSRFWERPHLLIGASRTALERGEPSRAREFHQQAVEYVRDRALPVFTPQLASIAALLSYTERDLRAAETAAAEATVDAQRMGMKLLVIEVAGLRAQIALDQGRGSDAAAHREHHERVVDEVVTSVLDPELRARLAQRLRSVDRAAPGDQPGEADESSHTAASGDTGPSRRTSGRRHPTA